MIKKGICKKHLHFPDAFKNIKNAVFSYYLPMQKIKHAYSPQKTA